MIEPTVVGVLHAYSYLDETIRVLRCIEKPHRIGLEISFEDRDLMENLRTSGLTRKQKFQEVSTLFRARRGEPPTADPEFNDGGEIFWYKMYETCINNGRTVVPIDNIDREVKTAFFRYQKKHPEKRVTDYPLELLIPLVIGRDSIMSDAIRTNHVYLSIVGCGHAVNLGRLTNSRVLLTASSKYRLFSQGGQQEYDGILAMSCYYKK